jgi:hypothetical protein
MKKNYLYLFILAFGTIILISACTTVNLTSWKDPNAKTQVKNLVVMALFEKLGAASAFENTFADYFNGKGIYVKKSLDFMAPNQPYSNEELKQKLEAQGADAVLIFSPRSADKSLNYTPPTYSGYYRGYYGGAYSVSPGYYSESTTYRVQANLYTLADEKLIWSGDLSTTDPSSVEAAASQVAYKIYEDWTKNDMLFVTDK